MPAIEVPPQVVEYLGQQKSMTLATASPTGLPHATTLLYVNDGPMLFFWTKSDTTTTRQIERNPLVSFAVDEYADDLRQTRGVQGTGDCEVLVSGDEIARVAGLFGEKFPTLSPGDTTSISFFRITPTDLQFIDNTEAGSEAPEGRFGAEFHKQRSYSVLTDLPEFGAATLAVSMHSVQVEAGEVIVREGEPADKFFIIVDGEVEVLRDVEGGTETIETLGPGHFFGEIAILRDVPRAATVRATRPTTLMWLDRDTFRTLVAQSLRTSEDFDRVIHERLGRLRSG